MAKKVSVLLEELAKSFASPDNELLKAAEDNNEMLDRVANALMTCSHELSSASMDILKYEPHIDTEALDEIAAVAAELDNDADLSKYSESIDNVLELLGRKEVDLSVDLENTANLATALDNSGDDGLEKLASVLDEILLTIGAPKDAIYNAKLAEEAEIEKLRNKYRSGADKFYNVGKERTEKIADEAQKIIDQKVKTYKPNEHALSTRYSPDMPGVSLIRIGDNVWQDPITKKIYNYETGFKLEDGSIVPGTSVSQQNNNIADNAMQHLNFSTRDEYLNG